MTRNQSVELAGLRTSVRLRLTLSLLLLSLVAGPERAVANASFLELMQGEWEGEGPPGEISVRVTGDSLWFFARDDFWYEATFTLPAGTDPQQLTATITDHSPPAKDVGEVILAIVKIEAATLTLAVDDGSALPPGSFEEAMSHYVLRRTHPEDAPECEPVRPVPAG